MQEHGGGLLTGYILPRFFTGEGDREAGRGQEPRTGFRLYRDQNIRKR